MAKQCASGVRPLRACSRCKASQRGLAAPRSSLSRRHAARGPFQHGHAARRLGGWGAALPPPPLLRSRRAADLACRTLEPADGVLPDSGVLAATNMVDLSKGALYPSNGNGNGVAAAAHSNGAAAAVVRHTPAPADTFKQLRQAVLTSLDFADNTEQTMDFEDDGWDLAEEISLEANASAAVGLTVYETLRIDQQGKTRRVYVRRRDLIRAHGLQLRDLRRVDPSLGPTKTSPSVTIKEECILVNIGGVRAVITADRCLLFEPGSAASRKFLEAVAPRVAASAAARTRQAAYKASGVYDREAVLEAEEERIFPFELEMVEAALMVATGKLEAELVAATRRVSATLQKLPREITPVNLEELRRVKQMLVELESKAENLRDLLEELMDDEEELLELNLSSRPKREEKRKQRERERLEREIEREIEKEAAAAAAEGAEAASAGHLLAKAAAPPLAASTRELRQQGLTGFSSDLAAAPEGGGAEGGPAPDVAGDPPSLAWQGAAAPGRGQQPRADRLAQLRGERGGAKGHGHGHPRGERERGQSDRDDDDGYQDAQDALEEMIEEEEAERELEEVEDLLEYYLQRAATTQSEAARLLAGARDLEESIGVSLSAKRFEVNRLELLLSIASFAAALGAMVASIFGMNLRSTLEMSVVGFWGTTVGIVAGSAWIFWVLFKYTKRKRIL